MQQQEEHSYTDGSLPHGPVRPMERQQLRPWLVEQIDSKEITGLRWMDRDKTMFRIPWKHRSRCGWKQEEDACLFMRWAVHTGKYCQTSNISLYLIFAKFANSIFKCKFSKNLRSFQHFFLYLWKIYVKKLSGRANLIVKI